MIARMQMLFLLRLAGLLSLILPGSVARAESPDLPAVEEIRAAAIAELAVSAKELEASGLKEAAAAWTGAQVGPIVLVWTFTDRVSSLQPSHWLVSVEKGGKRIGLLGLAPRDGAFIWRTTSLGGERAEVAKRIFATGAKEIAAFVQKNLGAKEAQEVDVGHVVTATVNGYYYWVAPALGENLVGSFCWPVGGDGKKRELWEAASSGRAVVPARESATESAPPFALKSTAEGQSALAGEAWMVGKVPLYFRTGTPMGWAGALAMMTQWWTPLSLGKGTEQSGRWQAAAGLDREDGVKLVQLFKLMRDGFEPPPPRRDGEAPKPTVPRLLRTVWFGSGRPLAGYSELTFKSDDPLSWIAREGPVLMAIDADGMGEFEPADQVVVGVGYSTAAGRLYVNNPSGLPDTYAFTEFDARFWGAWYSMKCDLPALCAAPSFARRGMSAGLPGDLVGPPTPQPLLATPAVIGDEAVLRVGELGVALAAPEATSFAGKDRFGEEYRLECTLDVPGAKLSGSPENGQWSSVKEAKGEAGARLVARLEQPLAGGGLVGGGAGRFELKGAKVGEKVKLSLVCRAWDVDDRSHFQLAETVKVFDDRDGADGRLDMARPALRMATGSYQAEVLLRDDDPSPPSLRMLSEEVVYDSLQGPYRFKVQISDPGGLEKPGVKWIFGEGQPKSFDSFGGQVGDEYFVDIPRDQWVNRIGETMTIFVSAKDADRERDGDQSSVVDSFKVRIEDDDVSGPNIVQFVTRRGENMQFQVLVKLEDESGVFVSESWPKLYYSFKGPVSPDSFDGIAKMVAAPKYGPGWFTAVAPWGEQGALKAAAAEERKTDTFIYFKVRSYDLDKDREKDDLESWSDSWAEVYLPAPLADSKTIFDIWPAGDREAGVNSLWDDWFDPPPSYVPSSLFFEGRPAEVSPEPVPEVLTGATARVRIHVAVSLAFVNIGATLNITGASLSLAPYKLTAAIVSKKGVWNLGALSFPSEEEAGGTTEVKLAVPPGALSTGENIVVLIPSPGTGEYDQLALERIHLEANELPEPPKIEE